MRRNFIFTLLMTGCALGLSQPVDAKALIRLSWRVIEIEESPRSQTLIRHTADSYVLDGNTISNGGYAPAARLGQRTQGVNGRGLSYNIQYSVNNGSILIRVRFFGAVLTESVTTDGTRSCSASVEYAPIPGQSHITTEVASTRSTVIDSAKYADQISCSIRQI